jgi:hypothetical protein
MNSPNEDPTTWQNERRHRKIYKASIIEIVHEGDRVGKKRQSGRGLLAWSHLSVAVQRQLIVEYRQLDAVRVDGLKLAVVDKQRQQKDALVTELLSPRDARQHLQRNNIVLAKDA